MIPLIIFVFGDLCIVNGRGVRRCGKTAMIPLIIFFAVNLAALDGAIPKLHVKNLPEKKTAGEKAPSQYCRLKICR